MFSRVSVRKAGLLVLTGLIMFALAVTTLLTRQTTYAASAVTINGATTFQTIDGFGASEAFGQASSLESAPSSTQQTVLNDLFSTSTGAGLTFLRNLLPSTSADTIEPNNPGSPSATPSYASLGSSEGQVALAKQAMAYGVQIYGDAWSAPGFMKTNGSESGGGTLCGEPGASCSSGDWRQAYANYLLQYVKDYSAAGVPLSYLDFVNEPSFAASYSAMVMSSSQLADFLTILGPTFKNAGVSTNIVCCDSEGWNLASGDVSAIVGNPTAFSYVNNFTSHGYTAAPTSPINTNGKHIWETEWSTFDGLDNAWDDGSDASGFTWAQHIYTGFTAADLNAFFYWWGAVASSTTDNEGLLQFNGSTVTTSGRLWALANYSRFIRPGAVRIGATSGDSNLQVSAYKNTNGTVSIVVLNQSTSGIAASYSLQSAGVADGTTVTPYLTNGSNDTAAQGTTSVSGGAFSATIPGRSLVTYVLNGTSGVTPTPTAGTTPTATPTPITNGSGYAVNAGGPATGSFAADELFSGGSTNSTTNTIDTSAVTNPAPQAVYQTERYGNFTYTFPNLSPGATYTVRLHEAEFFWTSTGQRVFNVSINGQQVLTNFDIIAAAGGADRAIVEQFTTTATSSGQIAIQFTTVTDNAKISGIEILPGSSGVTPTPTPTQPPLTPTPTQSVPTPTPSPTSGTTGSSCSIQYVVSNQWSTGFSATINITNTGSTPINGWTLQFSFANSQVIQPSPWNGTFTQSGSAVTVSNLSYNGSIAAGGGTLSSAPGFNGSWSGTNAAPTAFALNGVACSVS